MRSIICPQTRVAARRLSVATVSLVALAAALATGCGSASTSVVAPTAQKCQISVTNFTQTFTASGGSGSATIEAARECTWSAASQAPWIALSSKDGTGSGTLTFSVAANQAPQGRSGALNVNNQQLTVSQEPAPCRFSVSPLAQQVSAAGGTLSVAVSAMSGCTWTASSPTPWISLAGSGGNGSGTLVFTVAANPDAERTGTFVVAGQTVSVIQAAAAPTPTPGPTPPTPPPAPGCDFTVTPAALSFAAAGGQAALQVNTSSGCTWQASPSASWLTLSPADGRKSETVTVSASANTGAPRTATIFVAGQTVQVTQDALTAAPTVVVVSGEVANRQGDCPTLTFEVQGVVVVTTADTEFVNGPCGKLKNKTPVTVEGLQQPGQPLVATRVTNRD